MNIFELARKQEIQAETTYRNLAKAAESEDLRNIFTRLATDEKLHIEFINKMEKSKKAENIGIINSDILSLAHDAINKMKIKGEKFSATTSQSDTYKIARDQEAEAEKLYHEFAKQSADEDERMIFFALAAEEHKHYTVLENIIEFINYPANHPEDAEFTSQEKYMNLD